MVSTVKSRPNYYEMLGLSPGAASEAIAQAFARASSIFRPHAFGSLTEICVAFETLRDPVKRHAYDESLGLVRERKPQVQPYSGSASAHFANQPPVTAAPPVVPATDPDPIPDLVAEKPSRLLNLAIAAEPVELSIAGRGDAGIRPIEWKRTGMIVGGLAGAAVLFGALAGWWSSSSAAEAQLPKPAASASPTAEKAPPSFAELWADPGAEPIEAQLEQARHPVAVPRVKRNQNRPQLAATVAEQELIQPPQDLAEEIQSDPLAPEATSAPVVPASMPLPHRTVARTLDRIGYRCGSVASASAVEGASGVYKVTCTSGQSFQAKPVNGRYRFRRLAGN